MRRQIWNCDSWGSHKPHDCRSRLKESRAENPHARSLLLAPVSTMGFLPTGSAEGNSAGEENFRTISN